MDLLQERGYVIFRQAIDPRRLEACTSADNKADYRCMQGFIDRDLMSAVDERLGWHADYVKFRYSNNNNSSDASNLHRDIIMQKEVGCPCYTCLTYLDTTRLEVVPGSHRRPFGTMLSGVYEFLVNRKVETLQPGDIMVFSSTLLHRGIFSYGARSRRILQVFEVFPSHATLKGQLQRSIHVTGNWGDVMVHVSKTGLNDHSNFIHYLNAYTGYGILREDCDYLSSENMRPRLAVRDGEWQDINYYIMKHDTINLPEEQKGSFIYTCYATQIGLCKVYFVFIFALILFLFYIVLRAIFVALNRKTRVRKG